MPESLDGVMSAHGLIIMGEHIQHVQEYPKLIEYVSELNS